MYIVRDKNPDAAASDPHMADIRSVDIGTASGSNYDIASRQLLTYNHVYNRFANRFQILYSKLFKVVKNTAAGRTTRMITRRIRVNKPMYTRLSGGGDRGRGQIYGYIWCNTPSSMVAAAFPHAVIRLRINYTDS